MKPNFARVRTIAIREFLTTIRRKGFILTLVLMPLYGVFATFVSALPTLLASQSEESRFVAVVDPARILGVSPGDKLPMAPDEKGEAKYHARFYDTFEHAVRAFDEGQVRAILRIDPDYLETGRMAQYRKPGGLFTSRRIGPPFGDFLRERLLAERVEPAVAARVLDPVADSLYVASPQGGFEPENFTRRILNFLVPLGFGFILALGIFTAGSYLLQGLGEEKESRILESLLALVTPDELLMGKLLGLGSAAMLLVLAWGGLGIWALVTQAPAFGIAPSTIVLGFVYFLLGFLFFGTFMLGVGSLVSTFQESNQLATAITLSAMLPFFMISAILDQPNGPIATTLSLIPWTAPVTMMLRLPAGGVPASQIALSLGLLAASTYLMLRFAARLFRIGLLMYGKTPNLPEILRWARSS